MTFTVADVDDWVFARLMARTATGPRFCVRLAGTVACNCEVVPVVVSVVPLKTIWSPVLNVPFTVSALEVLKLIEVGEADVTTGTA